jgi:hypothetical protein
MLNGMLNARLQREGGIQTLLRLAWPGTKDRNQEKHPKEIRKTIQGFSYVQAVHGLAVSITKSVHRSTTQTRLCWTEKGVELYY